MVRRIPPTFYPGDSSRDRSDKLNRAMAEIYRYVGTFTAAAPLNVLDNVGGVQYWLDQNILWSNPPSNITINFTNDTFNFTNDTFNYTTDVFNFYGINNFYIENLSYWIFNFPPGGDGIGGIIYEVPVMECGYLFECCTTISLSLAIYNNLALPAVGNPDQGAIHYDLSTSNTGGTTITGITPTAFQLCNNGDVSGATGNGVNPIVLTVPSWLVQPQTGQYVVVKGVNGNTAANGTFAVGASTATTVSLQGATGNGAFVASPGSSIQLIGPQKLWLHNTGANPITIADNSGSSSALARILLPPTYGASVILEQDDSIELWWDFCHNACWLAESCTVDVDSSAGVTGTYYQAALTGGSVSVSTTVGTWTNILNLPVTVAGTYLIRFDVAGAVTTSGSGGTVNLTARLFDGNSAAVIANTSAIIWGNNNQPASTTINTTGGCTIIATLTATDTLTIQANAGTSTPGVTASVLGGGQTRISAVRIA